MGLEDEMTGTLRTTLMGAVLCTIGMGQTGVRAEEILVLLNAGVPSAEIGDLVENRGLMGPVLEAQWEAAQTGGAEEGLLEVLASGLESQVRLKNLAARFEVWNDGASGVSVLKPNGWTLTSRRDRGSTMVTMRSPRDVLAPGWFTAPRIFVWVQRDTPFHGQTGDLLGTRIAAMIADRLEGAGVGSVAKLDTGTSKGDTRYRVTGPDGRLSGLLGIRTRARPDGTVLCTGYVCANGDERLVESVFPEVVESVVVRP